jgi:glycosyltransferase involved in cell wall biosynthesis
MNKKVLEISVRSDIGGGPKHLLDLLINNNTEYKLYSAIPSGHDLSEEIQKHSKETIFIPHRKFSIKSFCKILSFCKKNNIKIIHSHGRGAGFYSRLLKPFGFKIIHTFHGIHVEKSLISKIKLTIDQLLSYLPLTDIFICVSNGEKANAIAHNVTSEKKTKVIYNGVLPYVQNINNTTPPKIAMLGRLSFQKGYDLLINSVEQFCSKNPDINFQIEVAGDGEDKKKLSTQLSNSKYAKERINFIGATHSPIDFLRKHTHFLSFSRFEGMPISVLEAMSIGLPCMVTDVVGNNDLINKSNGFLFKPEDFEEIFIPFITQNHTERLQNASNDIKEKYDINKQVNKTIQLYY